MHIDRPKLRHTNRELRYGPVIPYDSYGKFGSLLEKQTQFRNFSETYTALVAIIDLNIGN